MGIDRIDKKGPPAPPPSKEIGGPARSPETGRTFEVARPAPQAQGAAPTDSVAVQRTPLERLRAGEIDANGYLDEKVDEATTHLGKLPPAELEAIKSALRDRLSSDPALVDLFRTATGQAVPPPRDE
jgi:hypothetical protein